MIYALSYACCGLPWACLGLLYKTLFGNYETTAAL
jgi:hypothetical protein